MPRCKKGLSRSSTVFHLAAKFPKADARECFGLDTDRNERKEYILLKFAIMRSETKE